MAHCLRQGDVLLIEMKRAAQDGAMIDREAGKVVLAHGEVTGHAHAIAEPGCALFRETSQEIYLEVYTDDCVLRHEEHAPISLPRATYRVVRQREYEPGRYMRYVAD